MPATMATTNVSTMSPPLEGVDRREGRARDQYSSDGCDSRGDRNRTDHDEFHVDAARRSQPALGDSRTSRPNDVRLSYTDNPDLTRQLATLELRRIVALREDDFEQADEFAYAPSDHDDALDSYRRTLEIVGELRRRVRGAARRRRRPAAGAT